LLIIVDFNSAFSYKTVAFSVCENGKLSCWNYNYKVTLKFLL
jgi:hypothetical protein